MRHILETVEGDADAVEIGANADVLHPDQIDGVLDVIDKGAHGRAAHLLESGEGRKPGLTGVG